MRDRVALPSEAHAGDGRRRDPPELRASRRTEEARGHPRRCREHQRAAFDHAIRAAAANRDAETPALDPLDSGHRCRAEQSIRSALGETDGQSLEAITERYDFAPRGLFTAAAPEKAAQDTPVARLER